jgi:chemotaxis response regulator CheB
VRIGVVHDRPQAAEVLYRAVTLKPKYEVVWIARSGAEAVELCTRERPDLLLMDVVMSDMDGVEAARRIMTATPCAILIVTPSVRDNRARVFEAMGCGALDAVDMPLPDSGNLFETAAPLLTKIATISRLIGRQHGAVAAAKHNQRARRPGRHDRLVAIGASAGGPPALLTLLGSLPKDFPAAVVIVQHVDEQFAAGMTQWLGQHSAMPVAVIEEGDRPKAGCVLIAGTGDHLTLKGPNRLGYTSEPRHDVYRPSIDVFFQSVGRMWQGEVVGVVLTGMGSDGAVGLKALRDRGHHTIAQDKASSAVYGMPKAAAALNAAAEILPMGAIATRLIEMFARNGPAAGTRETR